MRALFILFFFCNNLYAQPKTVFNNNKLFRLTGRIDHYTPNTNNGFFNIKTYSITGRPATTAIPINKDGSFQCYLFQAFSGDVEADYEQVFFKLYATPGGFLQVIIDGQHWKQALKPADAMQLSGSNVALTTQIQAFEKTYNDHSFTTPVDWEDKSKTDEEAAVVRLNRMKEELKFVDGYLQTNKINSRSFSAWARNNIMYKAGVDIAFTSFTSSRNKTLSIEQLVRLLKDIPVNDTAALHNSAYYSYVRLLGSDIEIIINISPAFDAAKKQNGLNALPIYLEHFDAHFTGLARQLMYYNCYFSNTLFVGGYEQRFNTIIRDPYLITQWHDGKAKLLKPFEAQNIVESLNRFKGNDSATSRLRSIFEAQKDRHVFVTFWGTWCAPCMRDMAGFPAFISQFKENEPTFLFLGVDTKEEASKATQEKYGIRGTFITLTDNEASILNQLLKFYSYPTHFLLKPNSVTTALSVERVKSGDAINMAAVKKMKQILEGKE